MATVFSYLAYMLPFALAPLPFTAFVRWMWVRRMRRLGRDTQPLHEMGIFFFIAFLGGLLAVTILPEISLEEGRLVLNWGTGGGIHLIPFRIFRDSLRLLQKGDAIYGLVNLLGNILIFLPVGLLSSLLWQNASFKKALLWGLGLSLFIELSQLFLPARWTDLDDLWMNTLGALCGYGVYRLIPHKVQEKFWIKPSPLSRFSS